MSGRCAKCCCCVCPPGRSRREGEHPGVVGSSTGRGPAQAMYAHTAGCEGVTRDERATGMPCEPSGPGLFVPVAVDGGACDIYPQWAGTRPSMVSNPIICCFVTHWGSTTHGMRRPQHKKTVRTYRPLERGMQDSPQATVVRPRFAIASRRWRWRYGAIVHHGEV